MLQGWVVVFTALAYIGFLFAVASYGDRGRPQWAIRSARPLIYPLSLAVYCTSWTFFGSVGLSSRQGLDFLTIYLGPVLMVGLFYPLILKIIRLAKSQNITSIADFIAARYGKSQTVAAIVTLVAIIGAVPYIALQLKAVSASLLTMLGQTQPSAGHDLPIIGDLAILVTLTMALFAVLFGTRHIDATEHQEGLVLAIATESLIKLLAFLIVGTYVTYFLFAGPSDLISRANLQTDVLSVFTRIPDATTWITMTALSFLCIVLLPRQFHVTVVENNGAQEMKRAAWLFPFYLVLINLFVVPIAMAGMTIFPKGSVDSDMFLLALPLNAGNGWIAMIAFIGGLSAATAMVIVESVAVAIMVSNDLVVPLLLRLRGRDAARESLADMGAVLLLARRISIFVVLCFAYFYYRYAGEAQLAQIGLLSFAAIAQFGPAFFGGLIWRRATAAGAIAGIVAGVTIWGFTLLLPSFIESGFIDPKILRTGLFGLEILRPQALFGLTGWAPLTHGVFWSLSINIVLFTVVSLLTRPAPIEKLQANVFVPSNLTPMASSYMLWRSRVTVEELLATIARYLGQERTRRSFESFAATRGLTLEPKREADVHLLRYAEHLLASAIGAASSRLVLSLLLRKRTVSTKAALKLLDDASEAIQYNREILQTALDHVRQGIAVFDKQMQLVTWNRYFGEMLELSPDLVSVGVPLDEILYRLAERGDFGTGTIDAILQDRLERYVRHTGIFHERMPKRGMVIEVRSNRMPDGGIVVTYTDITPSVEAAEALERRVQERTEELTRLNQELARAKAEADEANISKTRFLAAASHDILQPLNAARLYATSLVERERGSNEAKLAGNVDASLEAVEEILGALLDISRLDTGALQPEISNFRINELLSQLQLEFAPLAAENGLTLKFLPCSLNVRSDRRLLRRLLQNLISNAIKYTPKGSVVVGCRRKGGKIRIEVHDTGLGIPAKEQKIIFREFQRLDQGAKAARGLGLGLSIVERIGRVLGHKIALRSKARKGSMFSVEVPTVAVAAATPAAVQSAPAPAATLEGIVTLCIDNDQQILDGMNVLLSGWGCRVIIAADFESALALCRNTGEQPDVLLVDYHLDKGNGIETIAALRKQLGSGLPAALITADRTPQVREEARERDIHVLNKPLRPAALRAFLAQWRVTRPAAE
ncbi:MAG: hybrid sensor histidine kinase/response regulator [Xanthobacteraceae bacterium]|nr:hybrid sensor histidine kinase/response regulator [Xanthobacteraceae bacterium]MCW5678399.1 hybrid sensor histidine kinase/response regulator [Xanthobacteraceae bacterium]